MSMPTPTWRRASLAMVMLVLAITSTVAPGLAGRRRPPPLPEPLYGMFVTPTVVHEGEQAEALASTLQDPVLLRVRDLVAAVDVFSANVPGSAQATQALPWLEAGWSRAATLPSFPPGIYTVSVPVNSLPAGQQSFSGGLNFEAPLLVRPATPAADVLLVFGNATQQAYNQFGGRSVYTEPPATSFGRLRPGFNRDTLFHARIAQELNALGISWEVTDTDYVEDHPGMLQSYRLVVLVTKYEYVTRAFRAQLETYFAGGGRVLAIGTEFATIQARREGDRWTCFKFTTHGTDPVLLDADPGNDDLATYEWVAVGEPETRLFGTSYWLGGWAGFPAPWTVHRSSHWLWSGTGLTEGAPLAPVASFDLIDGTLLRFEAGLPYPDLTQPTETPADFLVLATVPTLNARPWWCWLSGTPKPQCERPGWGVIGIRQSAAGGILLVLPDVRWMKDEKWLVYPEVREITRNALQTLASPSPVDAYGGYTP